MKLKLIKGRSYTATGVKVTAEKPIFETDDNKLAKMLVESGYFVAVEEPKNDDSGKKEKPVDKMTEKELDEYAAQNNIDLGEIKGKAEKLAKIQEVLKENKPDFEEEE